MTASFSPETDPYDTPSWRGIGDAAGLLNLRLGEWNEFGYLNPLAPQCKTIPPLGQRSAAAIQGAHRAIEVIDEIVAELGRVRVQVLAEVQADADARTAGRDADAGQVGVALRAELAQLRQAREAWDATAAACRCHLGRCVRAR